MSEAPAAGAFSVWRDEAVVRFVTAKGVVVVDAREHDLVVHVQGGRRLRLAASRAGLDEAIEHVRTITGDVWLSPALAEHLNAILRGAARLRGIDVDPAIAAVAAARPTPFVCSRGVLDNAYLLGDVVKFRAAAAAVAFVEDLAGSDANVPEQTDAWAYRLRDWRSLYVSTGSVARSVNRTLAQYGEAVAPELLWGLRHVVITAPLPSLRHVEVLGGLGALNDGDVADTPVRLVDARLQEIVLRASSRQLGAALVLVDEADAAIFSSPIAAIRLAEVLTSVPLDQLQQAQDRRVRFADLLEEALHSLREVLKIDTETIAPPIPLPSSPGIRFLATVGAIQREGVDMDHCVATRAPRALAGDSYLFHIDHEGARATAEVSRAGAVLEVRGPNNGSNVAVRYARVELRYWGARLALHRMGNASTSLWPTPSPPLPDGYEPVRTLAELSAALAALTTPPEPGDDDVWVWAADRAGEAVAGRRWLVCLRAAGVTLTLSSLDHKGAVTGNAIAVREAARAVVMPDDDDDDWNGRT
jgi:hypothetical protein